MNLIKKVLLGVYFFAMLSTRTQAAPSARILKTTYSVPVDEKLAAVATLPVSTVQFSEKDGAMSISYKLPPELAGLHADLIQLTQTNTVADDDILSPRLMRGTISTTRGPTGIASASCNRHPLNEKKVLCMILYHGLNTRVDEVDEYLHAGYDESPTLSKRLEVAALFRNEPVGILMIDLK